MPFDVTISIDDDKIRGILCTAFEGGMTRQWAKIVRYKYAHGVKEDDFYEGGKFAPKEFWALNQLVPLTPGCAVILEDFEDNNKEYKLDLNAIKRGLLIMAKDEPKHFADLVNGNEDSITGDVFVQCCVLREVRYG